MTSAEPDASLGRRFLALLIDWFIALGITAAVTQTPLYGQNKAAEWVPLLVFFVMVSLLNGLLGFTIGKRVTGLRLINRDGRPVGLLRGMLRTALLCLVIPALIMTEDKRGLHDLAAGSKVVPVG